MSYTCTYCTRSSADSYRPFHNDHIVPQSWLRLVSGRDNLAVSCPDCNQDKGAHDPVSWFSRGAEISAHADYVNSLASALKAAS